MLFGFFGFFFGGGWRKGRNISVCDKVTTVMNCFNFGLKKKKKGHFAAEGWYLGGEEWKLEVHGAAAAVLGLMGPVMDRLVRPSQ